MTKTEAAEAAKTIAKARKILEEEGWTQGWYKRRNWGGGHSYCLVGALQKANGPAKIHAENIISRCIGSIHIPTWNDARGRKFAEVKTVLLAAENIAKELAE